MTSRGAALIVGSVLLWLLGRTLGVPELYVAAASAAALVAIAALAVRVSTAKVSARRTVGATRLPAGATTPVTLELRNDSRLPSAPLLLEDGCHGASRVHVPASLPPRFVLAGLRPGRTAKVGYVITGEQRGRLRIGPLRLRIRDPFGLTERVRSFPGVDEVLVYPVVERLDEGRARGSHRGSEASDTRRLFNTGDEFYALREYVTGDDLRQVHWPSTAHRAKLMVRQQELPWQPEAVLFCDTRAGAHHGSGPDSTLEKAISVVASLAVHLADHQYELRLATEADPRPPGREAATAILDRLAELEPSRLDGLGPALSRLRAAEAGGLLAAVIAPPPGTARLAEHADVRALLSCGRRFGARLAVVVATGGARAAELSALLAAAGWKTVLVGPRDPFVRHWKGLVSGRPAGDGQQVRAARS